MMHHASSCRVPPQEMSYTEKNSYLYHNHHNVRRSRHITDDWMVVVVQRLAVEWSQRYDICRRRAAIVIHTMRIHSCGCGAGSSGGGRSQLWHGPDTTTTPTRTPSCRVLLSDHPNEDDDEDTTVTHTQTRSANEEQNNGGSSKNHSTDTSAFLPDDDEPAITTTPPQQQQRTYVSRLEEYSWKYSRRNLVLVGYYSLDGINVTTTTTSR
jgi:hypothetical protein